MSEAVRTRGLTKSYRLYPSYAHRALDALGLLPASRREQIPEHVALSGVDLDVRRGEKVAIIGRNGAGKSTLLKLVTGVLQPTAGSIEVSGNVKALLEIGAGFLPELTGRENVLGYLGHLGVTGRAADRALREIVEFAEVEEYLGQPMKTYSAGMAMRLMFSAATQIAPDILVLDEVLSVGDAYFSQKSFARIRELCASKDATLLLVTHDIYGARNFCERFIWIDAGQVRADGDAVSVVQQYEESVREQAEAERARKLLERGGQCGHRRCAGRSRTPSRRTLVRPRLDPPDRAAERRPSGRPRSRPKPAPEVPRGSEGRLESRRDARRFRRSSS